MTDLTNLEWKCHTPDLLQEILNNSGISVLTQPLNILGGLLAKVAERAIELNDPALNLLMLRLTLYDAADPHSHTIGEIAAAFRQERDRLKKVKP